MSLYGRVFAGLYDTVSADMERELASRRATLLAPARGRVVDLGAGTGNDLRHFGPAVTELLLVEPDRHMARRLEARLGESAVPVRVIAASAEALPLPDASVDVVAAALVFCTIADPARALAEVERVLVPGGRLLLLEHVRAQDARTARLQDVLRPVQQVVARGCRPNRDTEALMRASGLEIEALERFALPRAPAYLRPAIAATAVKPR